MVFKIGWEMQIKAEPGSSLMETPRVGDCVAFADDCEANKHGAALLVATQFYETLCRDLGVEPQKLRISE